MVSVHKQTIKHVAEVNEALRSPHAFQKVIRAFHLGHEFREQHRSTIGIHRLHQTVDGSAKVGRVGKTGGMRNSGVDSGGIGSHEVWIYTVTS